MCYYALTIGVRSLPGDIYINNFLSSVVEGIGYVLCFCIAWFGRKWPTVTAYFGAGAALLVYTLLLQFAPGIPFT